MQHLQILITDRSHPDHYCVVASWRPTDNPRIIEYRDGGVWSRLHDSQFEYVEERGPSSYYIVDPADCRPAAERAL